MADLNKELKRIEQGEAWKESDKVVQVEVKRPLDKVVPVRLSAADWSKLREEARALGIGPTTLARVWILERLRLRAWDVSSLPNLPVAFSRGMLPPSLTPKDIEIMEFVARGCLYRQIAEKLGLSEKDVESRVVEIARKLRDHESVIREESKHKV